MDDFSDNDDQEFMEATNEWERKEQLSIPNTFAFPFEPYGIQIGFMKCIYETLELGKIGIFESPTGTGKSLSLICGALTWLTDYERKQDEKLASVLQSKPSSTLQSSSNLEVSKVSQSASQHPDWIESFAAQKKTEAELENSLAEHSQRLKKAKQLESLRGSLRTQSSRKHSLVDYTGYGNGMVLSGRSKEEASGEGKLASDEEALLVDDYESDDEVTGSRADSEGEEADSNEEVHVTKIYYCSRTHSQLSQFVREVRKSPFGDKVKVVSVGSRQTMCVNKEVRNLKSLAQINDKCLDLQKNKASSKDSCCYDGSKKKQKLSSCPFLNSKSVASLTDRILLEVQDIEQLIPRGQSVKACPYYAARRGIPAAQLVVLPYNVLLHKSTRESSGIRLKGNIVIVDEAHNLLDAISSIHRSGVTGVQLYQTRSQLEQYQDRFLSRLKAKNLFYIRQLLSIVSQLIKFLSLKKASASSSEQQVDNGNISLTTVNDFLFEAELDNINFFKVLKYCKKSQIANKLSGFVATYAAAEVKVANTDRGLTLGATSSSLQQAAQPGLGGLLQTLSSSVQSCTPHRSVQQSLSLSSGLSPLGAPPSEEQDQMRSSLRFVENFLQVLTNANKDGRVVVARKGTVTASTLQYLLLNPAAYFADVLTEARAVIVAGGTMQPVSDFKDQLFLAGGATPGRILQYSCDHIMPPENLLAIGLALSSPAGGNIEFTFQNRGIPCTLDSMAAVVLRVCQVTPGGVVCFLPSYDYETVVYHHLEKSGTLRSIACVKQVFREPRKAAMVEHTLAEYAKCIASCGLKTSGKCMERTVTGAILFSVVGGKMSEGINFADDLGRCVIMVGLPYPNAHSEELKEKMKYLDATMPRLAGSKSAGQVHYENLCMKSVNQSIGRAIRHRDDYAAIILLDARYHRDTVISQLPGWVSSQVRKESDLTHVTALMQQFFVERKDNMRPIPVQCDQDEAESIEPANSN